MRVGVKRYCPRERKKCQRVVPCQRTRMIFFPNCRANCRLVHVLRRQYETRPSRAWVKSLKKIREPDFSDSCFKNLKKFALRAILFCRLGPGLRQLGKSFF